MKLALRGEEQWLHWPCWLVVGFAAGIAIYFALPWEPPLWLGPAICLFVLLAFFYRKSDFIRALLLIVLFLLWGFSAATLRTFLVASPQLERSLYAAEIEGRILEIEYLPKGYRITLDSLNIKNLSTEATPEKIRVKMWRLSDQLQPGDLVRFKASLSPLSRPSIAGGFDFRRDGFFRGLGATGFAFEAPMVVSPAPTSSLRQLSHYITRHIRERAAGAEGALMIALITGEQTGLPQPDIDAMRDSGLAHLLSISGLHIGMAFGLLFVTIRGMLALIPYLALHFPIKKWALIPAFAGAVFYALLAGFPVPTERSLIMVGMISLAILWDRQIFSLRTVAFAAFLVLLFNPEALIGPSFQLSFSAVTGLIVLYEFLQRNPRLNFDMLPVIPRKILRWLTGIILASLIATLVTAPFGIYHFNRLAIYGVVANLVGIPLTGFIMMPAGVLALLLMPLGWDGWAWRVMEWGAALLLGLGHWVQSWPLAVATIPSPPLIGLLLTSFGLSMLFFLAGRLRLAGIAFYLIGIAMLWLVKIPDMLIAENGRLFAVKGPDDRLYLSNIRRNQLAAENWLRRFGQKERVPLGQNGNVSCDELGCILKREGKIIALGYGEDALAEDCRRADLVINLEPIRQSCGKPAIDRFTLWRQGSQAIYLSEGKIEIVPAARENTRPWHAKRYIPTGRQRSEADKLIFQDLGDGEEKEETAGLR